MSLVAYPETYVAAAAADWIASSFVPTSYRDKQTGKVKEADVRLACFYLAALACDPRTHFSQTYVTGGRVQLMAEIQRVLCWRFGIDLKPVSWDASQATVKGRRAHSMDDWDEVTITMEQARLAKWPERNPSYGLMPDRMLLARACTAWVSLYAPHVKYLVAETDANFGIPPEEDEAHAV